MVENPETGENDGYSRMKNAAAIALRIT